MGCVLGNCRRSGGVGVRLRNQEFLIFRVFEELEKLVVEV